MSLFNLHIVRNFRLIIESDSIFLSHQTKLQKSISVNVIFYIILSILFSVVRRCYDLIETITLYFCHLPELHLIRHLYIIVSSYLIYKF